MQAFTVAMPGGTKDLEYEAYVRILNKWGIDVTDMPRVLEKGTPPRWLYAWTSREDAERFAKELRSHSRDKRWRVQEFTTDHLSQGPLGPVEIRVNGQGDSSGYALHPNSEDLVQKKFPHARLLGSVFVGHERRVPLERDRQESIWDHVAMILTGLSAEQLNELGGYRIYDLDSREVLREPEIPTSPTLGKD